METEIQDLLLSKLFLVAFQSNRAPILGKMFSFNKLMSIFFQSGLNHHLLQGAFNATYFGGDQTMQM